jgi:hypothetical protein
LVCLTGAKSPVEIGACSVAGANGSHPQGQRSPRFRRNPTVSTVHVPAAALSLLIVLYDSLLAVAQALRDRGSPWDQRGFIREPLRKVGVILLHDVEHGVLGEPSMVLGKESVQVSELFVVHGIAPQPQCQEYSPGC